MKKYFEKLLLGVSVSIVTILGFVLLGSALSPVSASTNADWNIHFTDIKYNEKGVASISKDGSHIDFDCYLAVPNESFVVTFDVRNDGRIDATVNVFELLGISSQNDKFLNYSVTYSDGSRIQVGDLLKAGEKKSIRLEVRYELDSEITMEDLLAEDTIFDLGLELTYIQK